MLKAYFLMIYLDDSFQLYTRIFFVKIIKSLKISIIFYAVKVCFFILILTIFLVRLLKSVNLVLTIRLFHILAGVLFIRYDDNSAGFQAIQLLKSQNQRETVKKCQYFLSGENEPNIM